MSETTERQREDRLLEQLDAETARLLFPERFAPDTVEIGLLFPPLENGAADRAREYLAVADVSPADDPSPVDGAERVRATFPLARVEELHGLFSLLDDQFEAQEVDVLFDGRRLPLVRELWLPLLWALRD